MITDAIECRVRFYANIPRVTHKVVCDGKVIGHVWSDGNITIDEPSTAPQVLRSSMYET